MTDSDETPGFRLAYVPGATPAKWVRVWEQRLPETPLSLVPVPAADAAGLLGSGEADAGLVRLPVDRTVFSAIPLYTETTVAVVPKDHLLTAADEVTLDDLADEVVLHPLDDVLGWESLPGEPAFERPATTADAVELVAAGIGVLLVPQSLARLHHRRDLTYRPVTDAPRSEVALAWPEDAHTPLVEEFVGIVRGRTANSTRGRQERERAGRPEPRAAAAKGGRGGGKAAGGKAAGRKTEGGKTAGGKSAGRTGRSPRSGSGGARNTRGGKPRRRS